MNRITIIGLGQIGASIGITLRRELKDIEIVGHDIDPEIAGKARKIGAVDKISYSLPLSLDESSIIIVAVPASRVEKVFKEIEPHLKPGVIVTDTSSTKQDVLKWAESIFAETIEFVGGHPMAGVETPGIDGAQDNLFDHASYAIIPLERTSSEAVDTVVNLIKVLGAEPFFIDPTEHDSLVAGVSHLPIAISIILMNTVSKSAGWVEMSRLAAGSFRDVSRLASGSVDMQHSIFLTNKESIIRWIDGFQDELVTFRELVEKGGDPLRDTLKSAFKSRSDWLSGKINKDNTISELPTSSESMLGMFGGDKLNEITRKLKKRSEEDR
jgi:prephenate dehydrogenase